MERREIGYQEHVDLVMDAMTSRGLLLSAYDANGRANAMTISWGTVGSIWGVPSWTILVRPSRYTYACIEHGNCFAVNVPGKSMMEACMYLGNTSGRDGDKLAAAGLTAEAGACVSAPTLAECPMVYECQVIYRAPLRADGLASEISSGAYADGDYHTVYFGKILSVRAAPNVAKLL